jgi:hypothetical protein
MIFMKLMKLLAVGQSVKEGKIVFGKYKLAQQGLLPKFASTTRPFAAEATVEPIIEKPVQTRAAEVLAPKQEPLKEATPVKIATEFKADETQKIPIGTVLKRVESPASPKTETGFFKRVAEKFSVLKPGFTRARRNKNTNARLVQTEWSLEKIKVARNDLSDADLEIVSKKKEQKSVAVADPVRKPAREWIKKTTRLFRTTSPFEQSADEKNLRSEQPVELAEKI